MANNAMKQQYHEVLNHIAYLVVEYPDALKKLLYDYGISFTGVPTSKDYSEAIVSKLKEGDQAFESALEVLIKQLNPSEEDQFLGGLIKGAVGLVGGLIRKKKARRRQRRASRAAASQDRAYERSEALKAQRALQQRIQQQQAAQRQRAEEERRRREAEERRRKEEATKREADQKRKNQNMLMIGGGILVLGIGAFLMTRPKGMQYPAYPPMRPPMPTMP